MVTRREMHSLGGNYSQLWGPSQSRLDSQARLMGSCRLCRYLFQYTSTYCWILGSWPRRILILWSWSRESRKMPDIYPTRTLSAHRFKAVFSHLPVVCRDSRTNAKSMHASIEISVYSVGKYGILCSLSCATKISLQWMSACCPTCMHGLACQGTKLLTHFPCKSQGREKVPNQTGMDPSTPCLLCNICLT